MCKIHLTLISGLVHWEWCLWKTPGKDMWGHGAAVWDTLLPGGWLCHTIKNRECIKGRQIPHSCSHGALWNELRSCQPCWRNWKNYQNCKSRYCFLTKWKYTVNEYIRLCYSYKLLYKKDSVHILLQENMYLYHCYYISTEIIFSTQIVHSNSLHRKNNIFIHLSFSLWPMKKMPKNK